MEAVPTGLAVFHDSIFVALFRGFPFPPDISVVQQVNPTTGGQTPFITGLKTAIDILPLRSDDDTDYLVLQHGSQPGPFPIPPGLLLRFETPAGPPTLLTDCLINPTSMTLSKRNHAVAITELGGRVVSVDLRP